MADNDLEQKGSKIADMTNRQCLDYLFESGLIKIRPGAIFRTNPGPLSSQFDFDRIDGMMLGLAIGDALGNTSETLYISSRSKIHGEIRDYLPNKKANNQAIGLPSDDTQMAFWTLEQMLKDGGIVPENISTLLSSRNIIGIGKAVKEFVKNSKSGCTWYKCGADSAGNGALMRIAPVVIPHLKTGTSDLWVDTALLSMLTHNEPGSISACMAFVKIIWELMSMTSAPDPDWWVETYVSAASDLEGDKIYTPRGGKYAEYSGSISDFVQDKVLDAHRMGLTTLKACNSWYSGAYLLETVPSVLYILMQYAHDPEEAIIRAVNDTRDNDTIAAIVGAAVGALHGKSGIPTRWIENLSGRTTATDDGKIFTLLSQARDTWSCEQPQNIDSFTGEYEWLSNFYKSPIVVDGITFRTVEHGFQAMKTDDLDERMRIASTASPVVAKRMGRKLALRDGWDYARLCYMRQMLILKFQNQELASRLLDTGNAILTENNRWHDNDWGSCTCKKCADKGENHLGRILMEIREQLREGI